MSRLAGTTKILAATVALLLVGALLLALTQRQDRKYLTADFTQTTSLYKGSDVKILGVPVGRVDELTPRGETVRVKISYDADVKLPEDVKAVVVSPSIVGDRFVQLAPAYDGGAALKDNGFVPVARTRVPVELDTIYQSLDDLSVALGPKGANSDGALSRLISGSANQLDGQGAQLNQTIKNFGDLSTTLANNKDELFGSVQQVSDFVKVLKDNDSTVRSFNASTAELSTVLAGEREDLHAALEQLGLALNDVNSLVKDNRGELRDNIQNLRSLSEVLGKRQSELEEITVNAPTALVNVALAYNGQDSGTTRTGTLDTRNNIPELFEGSLTNPVRTLCDLLGESVDDGQICPGLLALLPDLSGGASALEGLSPDALGQAGLSPDAVTDLLPRAAASSHTVGAPQSSLADMLGVK